MIKYILLLFAISFNIFAVEITSGITGSWFDSDNPGQGFNIEILDSNRILVYWYSYDQGAPVWLTGVGTYQGDTATVSLDYFQGGDFGIKHNGDLVTSQPFGDVTFTFENCNHGSVSYSSSLLNFGSGSINLDRLTSVFGLECSEKNSDEPSRPLSSFEITSGISGSWFDSDNPGQGFNIEILESNRILVYWYSYDQGTPIWLTGVGTYQGDTATVSLDYFQGGDFGIKHNGDLVTSQPFGDVTFTFENCNHGSVTYNSSLLNFGSGSINFDRLTSIFGLECRVENTDGIPVSIPPSPVNVPPSKNNECTEDMITLDKYIQIGLHTTIDEANQIVGCKGEFGENKQLLYVRWQDKQAVVVAFPAIDLIYEHKIDISAVRTVVYIEVADKNSGIGQRFIVKWWDISNVFHENGHEVSSERTGPIQIVNGKFVPVLE